MFWVLLVIGLCVLAIWLYAKFFKIPKLKNIVFVDGSLGSGKTLYSVYLAVRLYKRNLRRYRVAKFLVGAFSFIPAVKSKFDKMEKPQLYSNILLRNVEFHKITKDLLYRRNFRFAYRSVVLIDEFSLVADQFCYKDRELSERLSNFMKLFRHETKGTLVLNSQAVSDLHYSVKYVLSDYLYLHHMRKFPFFVAIAMQEMLYSADKDGSAVMNVRATDIEDTNKFVLVPKKYFKYYDSYCYSIFTDSLPVYYNPQLLTKSDSLKDFRLISFKEYKYLNENLTEEQKKEIENL